MQNTDLISDETNMMNECVANFYREWLGISPHHCIHSKLCANGGNSYCAPPDIVKYFLFVGYKLFVDFLGP